MIYTILFTLLAIVIASGLIPGKRQSSAPHARLGLFSHNSSGGLRRTFVRLYFAFLYWARDRVRQRNAAAQLRREKVAYGGKPLALSPTRPRALSRSGSRADASRARDQTASLLLRKLPAEVRQRVWELALGTEGHGGQVLHLFSMESRMAHRRCLLSTTDRSTSWHRHINPTQPLWRHACWGKCARDGVNLGRAPNEPPDDNLLALLKTCKQVYTEAITVLYTSNVFCVRQNLALANLVPTILPQRLASIRSVSVETAFNSHLTPIHPDQRSLATVWTGDDSSTWGRMCSALGQMHGLRRLSVRLDLIDHDRMSLDSIYDDTVKDMLAALKTLHGVKSFQVKVHWQVSEMVLRAVESGGKLPYLLETCQSGLPAKIMVIRGYPTSAIPYSPFAAQRDLYDEISSCQTIDDR